MTVRPAQPDDRARVLDLLGDRRAIDSPGQEVHVAEEGGRVVGASLGIAPNGPDGILGAIILEQPERTDLFHELLLANVERAVELGYQHGSAHVRRRGIVRRVERTYGLRARPFGRDTRTGRPTGWTFRVPGSAEHGRWHGFREQVSHPQHPAVG